MIFLFKVRKRIILYNPNLELRKRKTSPTINLIKSRAAGESLVQQVVDAQHSCWKVRGGEALFLGWGVLPLTFGGGTSPRHGQRLEPKDSTRSTCSIRTCILQLHGQKEDISYLLAMQI